MALELETSIRIAALQEIKRITEIALPPLPYTTNGLERCVSLAREFKLSGEYTHVETDSPNCRITLRFQDGLLHCKDDYALRFLWPDNGHRTSWFLEGQRLVLSETTSKNGQIRDEFYVMGFGDSDELTKATEPVNFRSFGFNIDG
ncbi:MAG TPA: hypothetical protein PLK94_04870 [Alphaproteobacteria bacterium]|nr:hypothetical protein [Alphaproteobacteria bacterium]HOO50606.1 hypothetical protein [Alphaproteobacteria bacterium]